MTNGPSSARAWADAHADTLVKAGLGEGAVDWDWHHFGWGSVFELEFLDESDFERFRRLSVVEAALDAAPARVEVYRGRGGTSGKRAPRRPRPVAGAGAVALPVPEDLPVVPDLWHPLELTLGELASFASQPV